MNKHIYEQGSAHVIVVSVLVALLIGALGFIFWQNFMVKDNDNDSKKMTASDTVAVSKPKAAEEKTLTYTDGSLSFKYPADGWVVYEGDGYKSLRSIDYEPYVGMGLKSGAEIIIGSSVVGSDNPLNPSERQAYGYSEVEAVKLVGYAGYKYKLTYEGVRYGADFDVDGMRHGIGMQISSDKLTESQKKAFDIALETLTLN